MFKTEPWQVPTQDGDQRPVSVSTNVKLPAEADETSRAALMQVAQEIVSQNAPGVQHWVNGLRQQVSLSGQQYMDRSVQAPGMDATYGFNGGQERLHLNVRPTKPGGAPLIAVEPNLDGYIVIVCTGFAVAPIGNPYTPIAMTYDFQLNGKSLGQGTFQSNQSGCVVIKFGQTALRCQSLADRPDGPGNPNDLVAPVLPTRSKTKTYPNVVGELAFVIGAGGVTVPAHTDVFGYFLYHWNSDYNLQMGMPGGSEWARPEFGQTGIVRLNVIKTIKGDATLLNNAGVNKFRANLISPFLATAATNMIVEAEFYDRASWRLASRSWTKPGPVIVNDRPMRWSTISNVPPAKTLPLDIDFTSKNKIEYTSDHPTSNGSFNGFPPETNPIQDGTPPYTAGYWRFGDGWSGYNGQPYDPWALVVGIVQAFSTSLTNLFNFMSNGFTPVNVHVHIGTNDPPFFIDYTMGPIFFNGPGEPATDGATGAASGAVLGDGLGAGPDSAILAGGNVDASYHAIFSAVQGLYSVWQNNYTHALQSATTTDVFTADPSSLAMLSSLVSDGEAILTLILGSTTFPVHPPNAPGYSGSPIPTFNWGSSGPSPFWIWQYLISLPGTQPAQIGTETAGVFGEEYANPIFDPPGSQPVQLSYGWGLTQTFVASLSTAYGSAKATIPTLTTLLAKMNNYTIPEN